MAFVGKLCKPGHPRRVSMFGHGHFSLDKRPGRWLVKLVPRCSLSFHCANYTKTRTYNPRKTKERKKEGRKEGRKVGSRCVFNVSTLAFISSKRGRLPAATYNTVIIPYNQWDFSSSIVLVDTDAPCSTHATDVAIYDPWFFLPF